MREQDSRFHLEIWIRKVIFWSEAQSDIELSTTICNVKIMGSSPFGK